MKKIADILKSVDVARLDGDKQKILTGISYSSKSVQPGHLFAALKGQESDGFYFIDEALARGAAAVLSERSRPQDISSTWIQVSNGRLALAQCAGNFYDHPSRELSVFGITGTKGKTTVSYLIESILSAAGRKTGVIGTINYRGPGIFIKAKRTTPEAPDLQRMMRTMRDHGADSCVMEISSHSLDLERVAGVDIDVAVFTNLSGDHMDYHVSMDHYFTAKKKLFTLGRKTMALINIDDPWGKKLIKELTGGAITYGLQPGAMIHAESYDFSLSGIQLLVKYPAGRIRLTSRLLGKPNVYNILSAAAACLTMKVSPTAIQAGVSRLTGVPGRFENIPNSLGLQVLVDYAHTDDALKNLLETARELCGKRIILTFGAGGGRDKTKRPRMGEIAGAIADWIILTSDNPRSEDPLAIISDVEKGLRKTGLGKYEIEPDRRKAIRAALKKGEAGDFILIAGKGHEDYQIFGNRVTHFDDVEITQEILKEMGEG